MDTQYITSFYVVYDNKNKSIKFSNAGHTRSLYFRSSKNRVLALDTEGFFLGIADDTLYQEKSMLIEQGDRLILYTDGIIEIKNNQGEDFGEERLAVFMKKNRTATGKEFCDALLKELRSFTPIEERGDDIAFLNIEF